MSGAGRVLRRLAGRPAALVGGLGLAALALLVLAAPLVEAALGQEPGAIGLLDRFAPPSATHPLGTDELGRDVLVRLLYGGQVSLSVGLAAALAAGLVGTAVGLLSGGVGGRLDALLMRVTDAVIALPLLPLLIVLAAVDATRLGLTPEDAAAEGAGLLRIVVLVVLFGWTTVARLVRAATLSVRRRDHVRAAVALGAAPGRVLLVHILPGVAAPAVVATTLTVGNVILLESVLSFLGLGIQPPVPSWGNMLTGAQDVVGTAPLLAVWPGLLIFLTVIAVNLLGDGLQEALDPRSAAGSSA